MARGSSGKRRRSAKAAPAPKAASTSRNVAASKSAPALKTAPILQNAAAAKAVPAPKAAPATLQVPQTAQHESKAHAPVAQTEPRAARGTRTGLGSLTTYVVLGLALLAAGASVFARVQGAYDSVFPMPGRVELLDIDPYYHLRHTRFAIEHFPHLGRWDVGTHYPTGEHAIHPSLFNLLLASTALILGLGHPSALLVEQVSAWSPVALHVIALVLLFVLARRVTRGVWWGLLALMLYCAYPGSSIARTVLGLGDHHALEIVMWVGSTWGCVRLLEVCQEPVNYRALTPKQVPGQVWRHARYCLPILGFLYCWSGAPLALIAISFGLVVTFVFSLAGDQKPQSVARAATYLGGTLTLGQLLVWGIFPELVLVRHYLVPLLLCSAALGIAGVVVERVTPRLVSRLGRRRLAIGTAALCVAVLALAWLFLPHSMKDALFGEKTGLVQEHALDIQQDAVATFGLCGLLALAAIPLSAVHALRHFQGVMATFVVNVGLVAVTLWLTTNDYGYSVGWVFALAATCSCWIISQRVRVWTKGTVVLAGAFGCALFAPPFFYGSGPIETSASKMKLLRPGWHSAMTWMRDNTPVSLPRVSTRVTSRAELQAAFGPGSYGVFSAWDFGNFVNAIGDRIPVWSHGISAEEARWIVSPDEETSLKRLCPACSPEQRVRYVVLSAETLGEHFMSKVTLSDRKVSEFSGPGHGTATYHGVPVALKTYGQAYEDSIAARLYLGDANGLTHYRLVYWSPEEAFLAYRNLMTPRPGGFNSELLMLSISVRDAEMRSDLAQAMRLPYVLQGDRIIYGGKLLPAVKIFERVAGARFRGVTYAGALVRATLSLKQRGSERTLDYEREVTAQEDGSFEIALPYSTEALEHTQFLPSGPYVLSATRRGASTPSVSRPVRVAESAVQEGREVVMAEALK